MSLQPTRVVQSNSNSYLPYVVGRRAPTSTPPPQALSTPSCKQPDGPSISHKFASNSPTANWVGRSVPQSKTYRSTSVETGQETPTYSDVVISALPLDWRNSTWDLAREDIERYLALPPGWAGSRSEAPSQLSGEVAKKVLELAIEAGIGVDRISPDVEGGLVVHLTPKKWLEGETPALLGGFYISNDGSTCSYLSYFSNPPGEFFDCDHARASLLGEVVRISQAFKDWLREE